MANSPDVTNIPGMTKEMRDGVVAAFDAMSCWRDEIESVNARCAGKVLDQMSATARAMGWSEQAVAATREYLAKASKMQTEVLDQLIDGWKRQLKSPVAPTAIPRCFTDQIPRLGGSTGANGMPEFSPLAPWTFWLQAAEAWQRTWMPEVHTRKDTRSH